jgi:hypothetical protein
VICSVGGGTIYISAPWEPLKGHDDGADDKAFLEIGMFLRQQPEGGDITAIVEEYQRIRAASLEAE